MSLVCSACERDMGPSESFPGREGVMVYPKVRAVIWADDESTSEQWTLHYVEVPNNVSLCFRCIVDKLPKSRRPILDKVWEAYEAETVYQRAEVSEKGRLLSSDKIISPDLFHAWEERRKAIPGSQCVFCGREIPDGQNPYFIARVIDKVYCEQHITWFFGQNYSWSDLKTGMTSFKICLSCFREKFPPTFKYLGYSLRGGSQLKSGGKNKGELYLTSQFIEALQREVGEDKAQELLANSMGDVEIKLAVDPDSIPEN